MPTLILILDHALHVLLSLCCTGLLLSTSTLCGSLLLGRSRDLCKVFGTDGDGSGANLYGTCNWYD